MPRSRLRVLVIGAGPAPDAIHLPVLARLRDHGEIVLTLVCDIQRERAAAARRKFGFLQDSGDGVAALGRTDIDAVYIFGSAQLHYEYGMLALQNGKHLFVEKPVAPTYVQARELAELASAQGLIAAGGLNRRFCEVPRRGSCARRRRPVGDLQKRYSTSPNFAIRPHSGRVPGWVRTAFMVWTHCSS